MTGMSLARCQLTCGPADSRLLWPRPQSAKLGSDVTAFNPITASIVYDPPLDNPNIDYLMWSLVFMRRDALMLGSKPKDDLKAATDLEIRIRLSDVNLGSISQNSISAENKFFYQIAIQKQ
jgi:hypothetical protein